MGLTRRALNAVDWWRHGPVTYSEMHDYGDNRVEGSVTSMEDVDVTVKEFFNTGVHSGPLLSDYHESYSDRLEHVRGEEAWEFARDFLQDRVNVVEDVDSIPVHLEERSRGEEKRVRIKAEYTNILLRGAGRGYLMDFEGETGNSMD